MSENGRVPGSSCRSLQHRAWGALVTRLACVPCCHTSECFSKRVSEAHCVSTDSSFLTLMMLPTRRGAEERVRGVPGCHGCRAQRQKECPHIRVPLPPATFHGKGWKKKKGKEHSFSNTPGNISGFTKCIGCRYAGNPERPALPMQSPAVSRSRHLTVCDRVSECDSAIVQDIRCFGYRNLTLETSSPSWQSSAVASPGPAKCCARSTSPLCHAVI